MKIDPKTGARYAHTAEEWAEVLRRQGAGTSLPASVAARVGPVFRKSTAPRQPAGQDSRSKKDG